MIDNRLMTIADMVSRKGTLLDVGTDHGYLPIYLIKSSKIDKAIASDVSKGSLSKAIEEVKKEKLQDKIETRLGSGLMVIKEDDKLDTVVLAGMGGILISELIAEKLEYIKKADIEFIVQPVQSPESVRKFFQKEKFTIIEEKLAKAEGRIYHIIKARYDDNYEMINYESETDYEIGKAIIESNDDSQKELLLELLDYKLKEQLKIKAQLETLDRKSVESRYEEVICKIERLENLINR